MKVLAWTMVGAMLLPVPVAAQGLGGFTIEPMMVFSGAATTSLRKRAHTKPRPICSRSIKLDLLSGNFCIGWLNSQWTGCLKRSRIFIIRRNGIMLCFRQ